MRDALKALAVFDPLGAGRPRGRAGSRSYLVLDVFTRTPLEGNALALVRDGRGLSTEEMQRIARELNLSETVFALPADGGGADARVRIFTPFSELPFAGHPVLGSAIALGAALSSTHVTLLTGAGEVPVELAPAADLVGEGRMRQPLPSWAPFERERELLAALGVERSQLPVEVYVNGPRHVYVMLESEDAVAALAPDLRALGALGEALFSCFAAAGARFKTRMFAPAVGVAEDPATGSAAGPLAVHACRHGLVPFGEEITISQGAEIGRPSLLRARAIGSADALEAVEVAGEAVIVADAALAPG